MMDLQIETSPAFVDNTSLQDASLLPACLAVGPFGSNPSNSSTARPLRDAAQKAQWEGRITVVTHDKNTTPEELTQLIRTRLEDCYYDHILLFGQVAHKAVFGQYYPALDIRGGYGFMSPNSTVQCHLFPDPFHVARNRFRSKWLVQDIVSAMQAPQRAPISGRGHRVTDEWVDYLLSNPDTVFDCETFGHQNNKEFRVLTMAAAHVEGRDVVLWSEADLVRGSAGWHQARRYLSRCNLSGHNRKYDLYAILAYFDIKLDPSCAGDDSYIIARLLRSDTEAGLEPQSGRIGVVGHKARAEANKHVAGLALKASRKARTKEVVVSTKYEIRTIANGTKTQRRKVPDVVRPPTAAESDQQALAAIQKYKDKHPGCLAGRNEDWLTASRRDDELGSYYYALVDTYERDLYCCLDVLTTGHLLALQRRELEYEPEISWIYNEVVRYAPRAFVHIENAGLLIDLEGLQKFSDFIVKRTAEIMAELRQYDIPDDFNPGSDDQVANFLFNILGLPVGAKTDGGKPSVSALALKPLKGKHPAVALIQEYSGLEKLQSNYADGLRPYIRDDNRIHCVFNIVGAATGRASCAQPNMQTIPSRGQYAKMAKAIYITPPGWQFLVFDYKTIEPMKAAELSGDTVMLEAFLRDEDFHNRTAGFISKAVWGNDFETCGLDPTMDGYEADLAATRKERRRVAKEIGLACVSMDTQILTKRGYLNYDDVEIGDETPGRTGTWVKITEKVKYDNAKVVDWQGLRVTPNHRWWSYRRRHTAQGRPLEYGFTTLETATTEHNLVLSVPQDTKTSCGFTPDECALLGWIVTDGHTSDRSVTIYQSPNANPEKCEIIQALIDRLGLKHTRDFRDRGNGRLEYSWRILGDDRKRWIGLSRSLSVNLVLKMSVDERNAFIDAGMLAEGNRDRYGVYRHFTQNRGNVSECYLLAFYLSGKHVRVYDQVRNTGPYAGGRILRLRLSKPHVTGQRLKYVEVAEPESVWCVRTEDETFTIRRGDKIALTGNTLYGQGTESMSERAGCTIEEADAAHKAIMGSYKILAGWIKACISYSAQTGYTWTHWNGKKARRRWVLDIGSTDGAEKSHGERTSYNTDVQGSSHEHLLVAAREVVHWLETNGYQSKLVLSVHDALYLECPEDEMDEVGAMVIKIMCRYSSDKLRLVVEAEAGPNLAELEPWTSKSQS